MLPEIQNDGSKSCSNDNYDKCMYNALRKHMMNFTANENGCTTPWLNNVTNICKKSINIENTCWIAYNRVTNQMNDCIVPCHSLVVSLGSKNFQVLSDVVGDPKPRNPRGTSLKI